MSSPSKARVPLDDAYGWAVNARDGLRDAADALDDEGRPRMAEDAAERRPITYGDAEVFEPTDEPA